VDRQRASIQPFLGSVIGHDGAQYFERFIEEKLKALNTNRPIYDEFEMEISSMDPKYFSDGWGVGVVL